MFIRLKSWNNIIGFQFDIIKSFMRWNKDTWHCTSTPLQFTISKAATTSYIVKWTIKLIHIPQYALLPLIKKVVLLFLFQVFFIASINLKSSLLFLVGEKKNLSFLFYFSYIIILTVNTTPILVHLSIVILLTFPADCSNKNEHLMAFKTGNKKTFFMSLVKLPWICKTDSLHP